MRLVSSLNPTLTQILLNHIHSTTTTAAFGLRSLDEAGRVHLETTPGGHCEFGLGWLQGLVQAYFTPTTPPPSRMSGAGATVQQE